MRVLSERQQPDASPTVNSQRNPVNSLVLESMILAYSGCANKRMTTRGCSVRYSARFGRGQRGSMRVATYRSPVSARHQAAAMVIEVPIVSAVLAVLVGSRL
jgi:hypothetical protein